MISNLNTGQEEMNCAQPCCISRWWIMHFQHYGMKNMHINPSLWGNYLNLNNDVIKSAGQKWGQTDTKWTNTKGLPPFHREIPELTSKFQPQHIYSCTITVCSWNYLAGPTHSHMRVYYLRRTHTLQRQLYAARGERGWGGGGGELTCTGWQHTLGRAAGIAGSTAALGHHYSLCSARLRTDREEPEGTRREGSES